MPAIYRTSKTMRIHLQLGPSIERIQHYTKIEQEKPATPSGQPAASWPTSGTLSVENLSARYSEDGPSVLRDLTFTIQSGEKVGIGEIHSHYLYNRVEVLTLLAVGRTGSGKSSLTLRYAKHVFL